MFATIQKSLLVPERFSLVKMSSKELKNQEYMHGEDKKFAFVCGLHKSGTSLLFRILRDHPDMSGFTHTGVPKDEGQHLQSVYPPAHRFGGAGKFGFDPESYLDETSSLATKENAQKLYSQWAHFWDLRAPVLLEKSPPNLVRTRFLQYLFPNSYFITILRHPIAISYATHRRTKRPIFSLIQHWLICHNRFYEDREHLRNVHVIKYEDLVSSPQKTMNKIYEFLGVKSVPMIQDVNSGINDKYFAQWRRDEKRLYSRRSVNRAVNELNNAVKQFGYSLKNLEWIGEHP